MGNDSIITIPSALIQCSGLSGLSLLENNLWWKLIDLIQDKNTEIIRDDSIVVKVLAKRLLEKGENSRLKLIERLRKLSNITIEANLDGRDDNEIWRCSLKLVSEYEVKSNDGYIYISVGRNFFNAVQDRATYARLKAVALFEMRGSKYSGRLYSLIRDKVNLDFKQWTVSVEEVRILLQVKEGTYDKFAAFRIWVLDRAVAEINEVSELFVSWNKAETYKNEVRKITFIWDLKDIDKARKTDRELSYSRIGRGKEKEKVLVQSDLVRKALKELEFAELHIRTKWFKRYLSLGYGAEVAAAEARENLHKWVDDRICKVMLADGFITE